jgi:tetratricopeptide (TPR) repeat protein
MSSAPRPVRLAPLLPLALALATVATAPVAQSEWAPPVRAAPASPAARAAPGDDLASLNDRARAALEKNQPGEAVELLEKALKLDPTQPVIRGNLAWAYFKRGQQSLADYRLDQAGADYKKAVELNPDEGGYAMHLGQLLLRRYRLEEAEKVVRTLLERHPDALDGWLLLGDISSLQDDLPGAQQAYEKAAASSDAELAALARTAADRTARQYAVEKDYRTDTTPFFIIRGPSQSKGPLMSVRLANVLDRSRAEVCAALNVSPQRRATVVLYPPDAFRQVTGTHDWVGGLFDRKIRLPIDDVERDLPVIESAFRHEFTHLIVSELSPGCPVFLNEGLADVMGEGRGQGLAKLAAYLDAHGLARDAVPSVTALPASFMEIADKDQVELAYLVSYAFVDHVVNFHGLGPVMDWVQGVGAHPVDEAYRAATGRTLADEEALFRDQLRHAGAPRR